MANPSFEEVLAEEADPRIGRAQRMFTPRHVRMAFMEAFEMVGGISKLVHWAQKEENYPHFLNLVVKLAPKELEQEVVTTIEYRSLVPPSPLNRLPPPADD
jgi:hypothetical protein